jgi:hypothetical protein
MIKKLLAIIVLVTVASLSIAGCTVSTTSPSNNGSVSPASPSSNDHSSHFTAAYSVDTIASSPFTKTTIGGHDTYVGTVEDLAKTMIYTTTIEVMPSESAAQNLYSSHILEKTNDGYMPTSTPKDAVTGSGGQIGYAVATWGGYKPISSENVPVYLISYSQDPEAGWIVTSMTTNSMVPA